MTTWGIIQLILTFIGIYSGIKIHEWLGLLILVPVAAKNLLFILLYNGNNPNAVKEAIWIGITQVIFIAIFYYI